MFDHELTVQLHQVICEVKNDFCTCMMPEIVVLKLKCMTGNCKFAWHVSNRYNFAVLAVALSVQADDDLIMVQAGKI